MSNTALRGISSLHEQDETAWLEQMADLVTAGRWGEIDRRHLAEYLLDMAKRDRREVFSRLVVLKRAAIETRLRETAFPQTCPWSLERLLAD